VVVYDNFVGGLVGEGAGDLWDNRKSVINLSKQREDKSRGRR
jgi:hypothetical protein